MTQIQPLRRKTTALWKLGIVGFFFRLVTLVTLVSYFCVDPCVWTPLPTDKADCTVTMKDPDFVKIMTGKINPQTVSLFLLMSSLLYAAAQSFPCVRRHVGWGEFGGEGVGRKEGKLSPLLPHYASFNHTLTPLGAFSSLPNRLKSFELVQSANWSLRVE